MKRFLQILSGLFLLIGLNFCSIAQIKNVGKPFIKNYDRSEYKAGQQNWMIEESESGKMLFANNEGVLVFDGHNWQVYPIANKSIVRNILVADNRIYAGGFNEFGYFETDSIGQLEYTSMMNLLPDGSKNFDEIWRIHDTQEGLIFQSFTQLIVINDGRIEVIKAPGKFHFSYYIKGQLIVIDLEKGIMKYTKGRFIPLPGLDVLQGLEIWTILPFGNKLLIGTAENGIYIYDGISLVEWSNPSSDFIKKNQLFSAIRINQDYLAFGTIQNGLLICTNEGDIVQNINQFNGLQNNTVLCLKKDSFGNLWVGTDNGIDYLEINSPLSILSYESGISAGYTAILFENKLYLGTNQGVFYKDWDAFLKGGNDKAFKLIENTRGQVWTLQILDNQLFCGHNNGTYIIKGVTATKLSDIAGGWTYLLSNTDNEKIIGGTYNGLVLFKKKGNTWKFDRKISGFNESSRTIKQDIDGSLWMSHGIKGVYHILLNDEMNEISRIDFYNSANGFNTDFGINASQIRGEIVFTTSDGIYSFNENLNCFEKNSFYSDMIKFSGLKLLREDNDGNIWYFANESVGVIRIQEDGEYVNINLPFRKLDGISIKGFEFVYPIDDQNVFFGSDNGFIHYNPELEKDYKKPFAVYFSKISINKDDSNILLGYSYDGSNLNPELKFKNNAIQFSFASNDFENATETQYSTYLEGFDSDWSDWEKRYSREYTNLYENEYTFYVKAQNIYGAETEPLQFNFVINPPLTRTKGAYFVYFIVGLMMMVLLILFTRRRVEKSREMEEQRRLKSFKEKEQKLEREALEAEKEIIRLRNEKLHEKMILKDKELANATLEMIQKNKFLTKIKNELKKIKSSTTDEYSKEHLQSLSTKINREINTEKQWEVFETHFESVHEAFLKRLKENYPELSPRELKLCAYLRLNISSKEISVLMNISTRGVEISRYRLRKKLRLNREENLTDFILSL